jgi:hypothetical protein
LLSGRVGVDADTAEIGAEAGFEIGPDGCGQRLPLIAGSRGLMFPRRSRLVVMRRFAFGEDRLFLFRALVAHALHARSADSGQRRGMGRAVAVQDLIRHLFGFGFGLQIGVSSQQPLHLQVTRHGPRRARTAGG